MTIENVFYHERRAVALQIFAPSPWVHQKLSWNTQYETREGRQFFKVDGDGAVIARLSDHDWNALQISLRQQMNADYRKLQYEHYQRAVAVFTPLPRVTLYVQEFINTLVSAKKAHDALRPHPFTLRLQLGKWTSENEWFVTLPQSLLAYSIEVPYKRLLELLRCLRRERHPLPIKAVVKPLDAGITAPLRSMLVLEYGDCTFTFYSTTQLPLL
jgi:hypothetical protein